MKITQRMRERAKEVKRRTIDLRSVPLSNEDTKAWRKGRVTPGFEAHIKKRAQEEWRIDGAISEHTKRTVEEMQLLKRIQKRERKLFANSGS